MISITIVVFTIFNSFLSLVTLSHIAHDGSTSHSIHTIDGVEYIKQCNTVKSVNVRWFKIIDSENKVIEECSDPTLKGDGAQNG